MTVAAVGSRILHQLKNTLRENHRAFNGWLKANATFGLIFLVALIAMPLIESTSARPDEAVANGSNVTPAITNGFAAARQHADEAYTEPLYPGRHNAICRPAPILGCICETTAGQVSIFPKLASDSIAPIRDVEYLRLVEWLRLTCQRVVNSK
jgi:hypothetical protein